MKEHPLLTQQRPTIGVFVRGISDDWGLPFWHGVESVAQERNVNLLCFPGEILCSPHGFQAQNNILYDLAGAENVDGLVIWTGMLSHYVGHHEIANFCKKYHTLPVVSIEIPLEGVPSVVGDFYRGMYEAVLHLIEVHRYRRIAFIRGPEDSETGEERYRAYIDALAEHGLPLDLNLIAPGTFFAPSGAEAIHLLLDERKADFEALVAANDLMALDALEALQARGVHVPEDMAVVGFDGMPEAAAVTPPLTTVQLPGYEWGRRGAELLLELLSHKDVPDKTIVPTTLIVRQSCGCADPVVIQAAVEPALTAPIETFDVVLARQRTLILASLIQALETFVTDVDQDQMAQLLDSFAAELKGESPGLFLSILGERLRHVITTEGNLPVWQQVLSAMRSQIAPYLGSDVVARAENLWQQARVMVGEIARRVEAYQRIQARQQAQSLREIGTTLITAFDVKELMNVLAEGLPHRLGIPGCYLALYENPQPYAYPQPAPEYSKLILAFDETGHLTLDSGSDRFPSRQLVPDNMLSRKERYNIVIAPLYFRENQIGFVLFEAGPKEGTVYEALRAEISSALQGALLVQKVKEHDAEIARQKYILDTFMENVPDSIYFKDRECRIMRANTAHASRLGLNDPTEEIGKTDFDFFPESKEAQARYTEEQEIMHTGIPLLNMEERLVFPEGHVGWSLVTKMPLRDEHGEIIGTFGISRDITPLKEAQENLEKAYSEINSLNKQLKAENLRMTAELDVARRLQEMILPPPEELQQIEGLEIVGFMQPADEVGGDYYDVLKENGIIHIGIGDVTGHGLESGVLMLMTQTACRTLIDRGETDAVTFLNTLNRVLYHNIQRMKVDKILSLAFVNYQAGQVKIVGQHEEILVVRKDGRVERVDTIDLGFPIGLEENIADFIAEATVSLEPGDGVVLYTDGITEAENIHSEFYGIARLCEIISRHWKKSVEDIKQAVFADVNQHIGTGKIMDDLTLIIMKQR